MRIYCVKCISHSHAHIQPFLSNTSTLQSTPRYFILISFNLSFTFRVPLYTYSMTLISTLAALFFPIFYFLPSLLLRNTTLPYWYPPVRSHATFAHTPSLPLHRSPGCHRSHRTQSKRSPKPRKVFSYEIQVLCR